jgi:transposase
MPPSRLYPNWYYAQKKNAVGDTALPNVPTSLNQPAKTENTWWSQRVTPLQGVFVSKQPEKTSRELFNLKSSADFTDEPTRAIKYRLRPTKTQTRSLNNHAGASRYVYNKMLEFVRLQPEEEQAPWFNLNRLSAVFLTENPRLNVSRSSAANETKANSSRARNAIDRVLHASHHLRLNAPWLKKTAHSSVLQQALKSLEEAFKSNVAKQKKMREKGERVKAFRISFKRRSDPSAWTFTLPAMFVSASHVDRPTNGPAVQSQTQAQGAPRQWTRLIMMTQFFGKDPLYVTQPIDLDTNGRPLADLKFSRDRLGRWSVIAQRAKSTFATPPQKTLSHRRVAFFDPGSRAGLTGYFPDGASQDSSQYSSGATIAYLEGEGGASHVFELCKKVDTIVSAERAVARDGTRENARKRRKLKRREHRLREKVKNLVTTAHIQICADIWSRVDTAVIPIFETHRMAKRPLSANDPARKINNTTVRQLFSLRHAAFRDRLCHTAKMLKKEYVNESEEYTTVACPQCLRVNDSFSGTTFTCAHCSYEAPRDAKSGLTLAVKSLHLNWRELS